MTLEAAVRAEAPTLADYDGAVAAVDFGDVPAEYRALVEGAAIVWLPQRRIVRAQGSERVPFLHGQLSSDVKGLETGRGQASLLLTAQGRVEGPELGLALAAAPVRTADDVATLRGVRGEPVEVDVLHGPGALAEQHERAPGEAVAVGGAAAHATTPSATWCARRTRWRTSVRLRTTVWDGGR